MSGASVLHRFDTIETALTEAPSRTALFSDPAFGRQLSERLEELLEGSDRILSLDVFDTLVLRDNSSEITRFYEIGGQMAEIASDRAGRSIAQVDAFLARHLGTKATYRASAKKDGHREGSLRELHKTASTLLTGAPDLAGDFIAAELAYEATRIVPNPFLCEYMDRHRAAGGRVVLLTDMYMHADQVATLLEMLGIGPERYDSLISSADTKVSKASGHVFALAERDLDAAPEDFLHLGDSFRGDVAQPLRRGWKALHLPVGHADTLERRRDHVRTAEHLDRDHGLAIDIAMPH